MPLRVCLAVVLSVGLGASSCRKQPTPDGPPQGAADAALDPAPLPVRAEVVAESARLAVLGSRAQGEERAALFLAAARLRERIWRRERREPDALEALELLSNAAETGGADGCNARLERAVLEGEMRREPSATYRAAYVTRSETDDAGCRRRIDDVLVTLGAFRPLPTVLAELDRDAKSTSAAKGLGGARLDPSGPVVVPALSQDRVKGPTRITSIERYGSEDAARVVVHMTQPALFDVGFIAKEGSRGPRLFIDVKTATYKGPLELPVGGLVERVRLGKQASGTRVVLDLRREVWRKVFYLPEPFRLVIDVSKDPPEAPTVGAAGGLAGTSTGPRPIRRVVLDPGHGGHDPGAVGPGGLREKDVTLDIAHRAAPLIARELGIVTMLTRDSDVFVPLDERAARANAFQADVFLSIHCNANEGGTGRGVMTFVLDQSRDPYAMRIAARENASSEAASVELAAALSQVVDQGVRARSNHFAELLQRAAMASLAPGYDTVDHGVKRAGFYVLAGARMPAVLFESSFISHPVEEARLDTGDYRQKLADAVVNAVRAYRDGR